MNKNIKIRQSSFETEKELEQLVELQNIVYKDRGKSFNKEEFHHWYLENPFGNAISFNAFDGDKMVSHYVCITKKIIIGERVVDGILSMATVTHPEYRGRGLFKTLAKKTYEYAQSQGYEFVIGVANANSFPGFIKHFPFQFVAQLDVKIGFGYHICKEKDKLFSGYWNSEAIKWRCRNSYKRHNSIIVGNYGKFCKTLLGDFPNDILDSVNLPKNKISFKPVLYVGLGAKTKGLFINVPKFIKRSPFNLIFMDLTGGKLPKMTKDNVLFRLFDFDVA